jgi:hypothetical protein
MGDAFGGILGNALGRWYRNDFACSELADKPYQIVNTPKIEGLFHF